MRTITKAVLLLAVTALSACASTTPAPKGPEHARAVSSVKEEAKAPAADANEDEVREPRFELPRQRLAY